MFCSSNSDKLYAFTMSVFIMPGIIPLTRTCILDNSRAKTRIKEFIAPFEEAYNALEIVEYIAEIEDINTIEAPLLNFFCLTNSFINSTGAT